MKPYTLLAAVGLLGALSGLTTSASADCTPGTPGCPQLTPICPADKPACWIVPPQSIEVNAGGVSAGPGSAGGGAPVVLTPAQYRIEIPLVTPVPFPTRRAAVTTDSGAQTGLSSAQETAPGGIGWQEALGAAAAAAMGIVTTYGIWKAPPGSAGGVSGASSWAGSSGFRPVAGSGGSASPSAGASLRPSLGGSAPQAGTGAQASWPSGGPSSAWGSEGAPLAEPTAEERRQGSDWGGVIGAAPRVTWQGDLSYVAGDRMSTATAERKAEDMLPRATWIPGGGRSDPGPEPTPTSPFVTPAATPRAPATPTASATATPSATRPAATATPRAPTPTSPFITPTATPIANATATPRGEEPEGVTNEALERLAGAGWDFHEAEHADPGSWNRTARAVGRVATAPVVAAGRAGQLVVENGLEKGLDLAGQEFGAAVERRTGAMAEQIHRAAERMGNAGEAVTRPINAWAAGELGEEIRARGGVPGILRETGEQVEDALHQSLVRPNSPQFEAGLSRAGTGASLLSMGATIAYGRTGNPAWRDVAGVGDVIGGAVDIIGLRGNIVNVAGRLSNVPVASQASGAVGTLSRVAQVVGKVAAPLAALTGAITVAVEYGKVKQDLEDGRLSDDGRVSVIKAAAGALAVAGGVTVFAFPPAAPVLFAVSGILQGAAWVYENRQRLWDGLKAYQGVAQNAKVIVNTVVQRAAEKVTSTVAEAAKSVTGFFGRLFGGGGGAPAQSQPTPPRAATPPPARTPAPSTTPRPAATPRPASAPRPAASPAKPQPGAWRGR